MQLIWIVCSYIIGSIPCGLIIAKRLCDVDPRTAGSKNVGSTNVGRLCGKKYGAWTLACDILKGYIPVALTATASDSAFFITCVAVATLLGHVFSCFLGFNGGKAVATTVGVYLAIAVGPLLIAVILCLATVRYTRFMSLGSLVLVAAMPVLLLFTGYWSLLPLSLIILALVVWTHRQNIQRLVCGTESPWNSCTCKE